MIELIAVLALAAALYMGWNLGSNDAANCIGTAVGGGILSLRRAVVLVGFFALLGAVISGGAVIETFSGGVIPPESVTAQVAFIAAISAGSFVTLATYSKFPVSTTHAIIGAMLGVGLAMSVAINWSTIGKMGIVWVGTPTVAMALGFVIYKSVGKALGRIKKLATANLVLKILVVVSGCYAAYSLGANNIGNVTGLIAGAKDIAIPMVVAALIGGIAIMVGVITWGGKVIETVGKGMTVIDPAMAFSAQLSTALVLHIYSMVGMPTSASHAIIGAIIGVGFVKGMRTVNMKLAQKIVIAWVLTPVVAAVVGFTLFRVAGLF